MLRRITGTGLGRSGSVVHWGVVGRMVIAWGLTLPAAGLMGAGAYGVSKLVGGGVRGSLVIGAIAIAILTGLVILSRRDPVSADNVIEMQMDLPSAGHPAGGDGA